MAGLPTMVVTRAGFSGLVANAFAGIGFSAEAPSVYEFPIEMFLLGADLTPLRENIDKIVYGLTKWEPEIKEKGVYSPGEKIVVQGEDYQDAVDKMNQLFLKNMWSDGLPITPATEERVNWILTGTDLPRDTLVAAEGKIYPRGGIATVESVAVALAMAGGRPEYLPLLVAIVEAITVDEFNHHQWSPTTVSNFPAVVVNGPMAKEIRLGSRYGVMGPDPVHPSNGPIGRALRFILMNLGGAVPGIGTMGIYGGMRFVNAVFAEDEAGLPPDWKPLSATRGFAEGSNVITVLPVMGVINVQLHSGFGPSTEELELQFLYRMAGEIGGTHAMSGGTRPGDGDSAGIILMGRNMAQVLTDQGWTRETVKAFLEENARPTWETLVRTGRVDPADGPQPPRPIAEVLLAVAGGDQSGQAYWMPSGRTRTIGQAEIKLPANWDALLAQAEKDLGPLPAD
jgi:hypothetical protein